MSKKVSGECLCKAVKVHTTLVNDHFGACHCEMCQTWSGGANLVVEGSKDTKFEGEEFIQVYTSSEWGERGFCKRCGTHLFFRLKSGDYINFPLGLLTGVEHLSFDFQIFFDKKSPSYGFANQTRNMTEAEFLESLKLQF